MRYLHLDVFTDRMFEGNQLAVFPEPGSLSPDQMQKIANEMNFSETTFILPREADGDVRMRIFTPKAELPMAGHPTIGSTFALALEGRIPSGRESFVFELGVGPTPVSMEWSGKVLDFAWMTQLTPTFMETIRDRVGLASALRLPESALSRGLPAQCISCGVPFLFVPVATRAAVDAVAIDGRALASCLADANLPDLPVFTFSTDGGATGENVYSRMLAPTFGIAEDPATGSASGPLGCYLVRYGLVTAEEAQHVVSLQGVAMGRPSRVHISIDSDGGAITRVRIGGRSVLVGTGEVNV